jgi:hypothetical protein
MSFAALWLPIVLSAVLVFVASTLIHMVLKWHNSDHHGLSNEDAVRAVMRAGAPSPGEYMIPYCGDHKLMRTPEFQKKFEDGPVAMLTVRRNGFPGMGPALVQWFLYSLAIAAIAAYVACVGLGGPASFNRVLCMAGLVAFVAYAGGGIQGGIWMGKPWRSVSKDILDALIYAAITGATIAWLWPR